MEIDSPPPPPLPPHPLLQPATCDLHPGDPVIGFCASCLHERLAALQASTASDAADAPRKSSSSAIKSIFSRSTAAAGIGGIGPLHYFSNNNFHSSSFLRPELRRCKSFSASRGPTAAAAVEPQRKSCDVRGRNTRWSLFHQDDRDRAAGNVVVGGDGDDYGGDDDEIVPETITVPYSDEIMACSKAANDFGISGEMEEGNEAAGETKPMKDHIDLESPVKKPPPKDLKDIAGSFWVAASVFSKKLRNWRRKQKLKKKSTIPSERACSSSRRFCETRSEFAVDAYGRHSCDIDPRFSLDAGRFSLDDPRLSWDAPRASWDGYLISGGRSMLPRLPPMLAVVEDPPAVAVQRFDGNIPVEEDIVIPGGSLQTRDYYDSGSHRRSLERSNSTRKQSFETENPTRPSISEQVPSFHGSTHERDSRVWSSNSLRDECSGSFDSGFRDQKPKAHPLKQSRRWSKSWSIWGFIHRRSSGRNSNRVEMSMSETWPEFRTKVYNDRLFRSNRTLSSRSLFSGSAGLGSMRMNGVENNGHKKKFLLERNRSARFSPSHFDNGLLKFYLPPVKSGVKKRGGCERSKCSSSPHSFTGSMPSLY